MITLETLGIFRWRKRLNFITITAHLLHNHYSSFIYRFPNVYSTYELYCEGVLSRVLATIKCYFPDGKYISRSNKCNLKIINICIAK